ncbi:GDP-mannose mannosyl hydrolase [Photobacterium lipolyticum]|uniref:GDP-mannose mannosyl hydrolase n=1 Tax=Photobacterium lipolyticum TaxID=266810 RepID=A0A2T3MVA1_9GAMM|nr:GDP-mannose mannosyl hydrolase [Photobacterium lipolyticum]PSW03858.1 GDP-mannose mannosyl hydrolase [Photobacterium lipolyticum]
MYIEKETFKTIIQSTPLVSIDLIIQNLSGQVLLGKRLNKPAQGFWFVPGGRICKNESIEDAYTRLVLNELGVQAQFSDARSFGTFEHFYQDNVFDEPFSTHYIVLGYELALNMELNVLPKEQHSEYKWFSIEELLASPEVHKYTKQYFINGHK